MTDMTVAQDVSTPADQAREVSTTRKRPASRGNPNMLQVIAELARDKTTDVEKFERFIALQERLEAKAAKMAWINAMADVQPELPVIRRNGRLEILNKDDVKNNVPNPRVIQSTPYSKWDDISRVITPILNRHGLVLSHKPIKEGDRVVVRCTIWHRDGHSEESELSLPMDPSGSKNNVQSIGSSIKYGMRYTAVPMLNITSEDPLDADDDGRASGERGAPETLSDEQLFEMRDLLTTSGANYADFLKFAAVFELSDIPASKFADLMKSIRTAADRRQKQGK